MEKERMGGCGDPDCPDCGGEDVGTFTMMVDLISEIVADEDPDTVIRALCFVLGQELAREPAESRQRLRRSVNTLLTETTKFHVIQACDA